MAFPNILIHAFVWLVNSHIENFKGRDHGFQGYPSLTCVMSLPFNKQVSFSLKGATKEKCV